MPQQYKHTGLSGVAAGGFSAPHVCLHPAHYVCNLFRFPKDQMQEIEKGDSTRTLNTIYFTERGPFGLWQGANASIYPGHSWQLFEILQEPKPDYCTHLPPIGSMARRAGMGQTPALPLTAV